MISCSNTNEYSSLVSITLQYKGYQFYDISDSTLNILYSIPNNTNGNPGWVKVSKNAIYKNQDVNHNQPYITTRNDTIWSGFDGSSLVKLIGTSRFSADTLIMGFHVSPLQGSQYNITCKYIR